MKSKDELKGGRRGMKKERKLTGCAASFKEDDLVHETIVKSESN